MRKFTLLLCCFWAITIFAKTPVQFCVSFEDEEHYRLLLLDEIPTDFTPSKKLKVHPIPYFATRPSGHTPSGPVSKAINGAISDAVITTAENSTI